MSYICRSEPISKVTQHTLIFVHTEEVIAYVRSDTGRESYCTYLASLSVSRTIAPDVTYEDLSK